MKRALIISILAIFAQVANAQITFNFHDGAATVAAGLALDNDSTDTFETGGVTMTATAFLDGVSNASTFVTTQVLNAAGSSV